ncbi:outer membrane beta-barrel protein [Helicobacter aurati]|uniref:Outer membrane beta-barrel protein n=1 Tax=Helicobacter aurati TaxID=137778 RepID=A0A3D8IVX2_9HELI|nr:outer membrane beta-barrel protein [Helicobacter aurati]RDU69173.1 outer membrane beta-barrel protein [Helicobacter aurati]
MKKILALSVISLSLSASLAEARFLLGVEGGYNRGITTLDNGFADQSYKNFINDSIHGWNAGINIGGQWFFGERIGMRTFLGFIYGQSYLNGHSFHTGDININFDLMADIIKGGSSSFGVFVGAGGGYSVAAQSLSFSVLSAGASFPIYARAGFSLGLGESSRIDLTAYLPLLTYSIVDTNNSDVVGAYNPLRFTLSYKFMF